MGFGASVQFTRRKGGGLNVHDCRVLESLPESEEDRQTREVLKVLAQHADSNDSDLLDVD